eukprot:TRINITY_DN58269_c0_g1_i1.p2 TRINITY_DN58269_c0_g1~~TRINITY_DN58269_c0_g1_i1.p2  ORF type:complete len:429 (+),score=160.78 TRINITY_DN58269_c0_g1_i1:37-1323(+)
MSLPLAALAALCSVAAGAHVTSNNVVVMDMQASVHHQHREIVYQHREKLGSDPMGGNIWPVAIYWVYIEVGTPPRKFPVAIDTGSFTLDIPDVACDGCISKSPNNVYDANSSSTSTEIPCGLRCTEVGGSCRTDKQCGFSNTYETCDLSDPTAPCTIKGVFRKDVVTLGGATGTVDVSFGTITSQTSNFDQFKNIDGVLGLAGPSTGLNTFELLVKAGKLPANVFAMCFVEGKTSNGTITFGGVDPTLYTGSISYVPDTGGLQFYSVELKSISVAGTSAAGTSSQRAILDSGTNILLLPTDMYKSVRSVFEGLCDSGASLPGVCNTTRSIFDSYCYDYTPQQLATFPNMSLALNGVNLGMEPRNYLLQGQPSEAPGVYCLGIRDTGRGGLLIIGDTTMENYYMVMDRENSRIGWAPVNRTTCGSVGSL